VICLPAQLARDRVDGCAQRQPDPFRVEDPADDFCRLLVFPAQQPRDHIEDRHLAAEAPKSLRQFSADGTRADHGQARRQACQIPDLFIGEMARFGQPGNRRRRRSRAGGNHRLAEVQGLAVDLDAVLAGEAGVAQKHVDAQFGHPVHRVVRAEIGAHPAHALHDLAEVDRHTVHLHAELARPRNLAQHLRGTDHRLGGHAAYVEAVAAEEMAFDQRHFGAQPGRADSRDQARRTAADDDKIVSTRRLGILPVGRMDIGDQPLVGGAGCGFDGAIALKIGDVLHVVFLVRIGLYVSRDIVVQTRLRRSARRCVRCTAYRPAHHRTTHRYVL
jgi:hypothetical protein